MAELDILQSLKSKEKVFNELSERSDYLSSRLFDVNNLGNFIETKKLIFKSAFSESLNYINDISIELLIAEIMNAAIKTKEYDYGILFDALIEAINIHRGELISITPYENESIDIIIDLTSLGTIEQYALAVKSARESMQIGKSEDADARSLYWARYIYGTGRQGLKIKTTTKKGEKKDTTGKYAHLYEETMRARLSYLSGIAPFWYLIEYGNAPGTMEDIGGFPYPEFPPTHFLDRSIRSIEQFFKLAYSSFKIKALIEYSRLLLKSFHNSLEKFSPQDLEDTYNIINRETTNLLQSEINLKDYDTSGFKVKMSKDISSYEQFYRRKKRVVVGRGAKGRFVSTKGIK